MEQEYAIGIYSGPSPVELLPDGAARNPVLTREHVSDASAAFVADPFMMRVEGLWYMFFEVLNRRNHHRGEIGAAVSRDARNWSYKQIVLAEPFHLSYPHVFGWNGDYYMIPESHKAGEVRLYRAIDFPVRWEFVTTLLRGSFFVDPSLFRFKEKWWLFVETNPEMKGDTLRLFYADDLVGRWREHPSSPVVRNGERAARPAGRVQVMGDSIIRYAQDCYPVYGKLVRAFEICDLSENTYGEREIRSTPVLSGSGAGWNESGMHHVDAHQCDGAWLACVDGWRAVPAAAPTS
jgi:hypothetical protein